jgi:hypothetical protein
MRDAVSAGTRVPARTLPTRFRGSAPLSTMSVPSCRALAHLAQRDATASGSANCWPESPAMKRPPRISPRASRRW